jgi:hypothetical protein
MCGREARNRHTIVMEGAQNEDYAQHIP